MTTLMPRTVICKNCGSPVFVRECMSTNQFGSPDLDLRPPPMARNLIHTLFQYCTECGYAGEDITRTPPKSPEFQELLKKELSTGKHGTPVLEELYERAAQTELLKSRPDPEYAAMLYLKAAWVADDYARKDFAAEMRKQALAQLLCLKKISPDQIVQMIDIARRAGDFEKAKELIENFPKTKKDILVKILDFQKKLVEAEDSDCYTIQDACE